MTPDDTGQTARLHLTYLSTGFFPQLGFAFVRRWHQTFIDSPTGIGLVSRDRDRCVVAFLLGSTDQQAYVRDVLKHDRLQLAWRGVAGLLRRPDGNTPLPTHTRPPIYLQTVADAPIRYADVGHRPAA